MNIETIQSSLNKGLSSSREAACYTALGAQKIAYAAPGLIAQMAKEIALAAPGIIVDIVGSQIAGAGYDWAARPLAVGTHSLFWKKTNRPNAAFNAFSLPVGRAIIAVPKISQAVDAVANVTSKASDCITNKIPETLVSKQAVQMLKDTTKFQFIGYLQALVVYKLASAFFKVDKPEPSIAAVISPMNLVWIGFMCSLTRLIAYLESGDSELKPTETLPSEPARAKAPTQTTPSPQVTKAATNQSETEGLSKLLQPTKAPLPKKSWKERCFRTKSKTAVSA